MRQARLEGMRVLSSSRLFIGAWMLLNQRILWGDNGTIVDMSAELNDLTANSYTIPLVGADDYLYIGSDLPFNHRFFYVDSGNDSASVVSVDIWDGGEWVAAVDVQDETKLSGKSLKQSGIISWATDRNKGWSIEDTTENVTGLTSVKIYNMYWVRLSFSADFTSTTTLKYVGHKFSKDADLLPLGYADLNRSDVKTSFEAGKLDWTDQHIAAGEAILKYLQAKRYLRSGNQILDWRTFSEASIYKLAEIIYTSFGSDFEDRRALAEKKYHSALNSGGLFNIDRDADGHKDVVERVRLAGIVRR